MHFILPYFIIILVVIQLYIKKSDTSQKNNIKKFWEREQKANATRKKDISTLKYIEWDTTLPVKENNTLLSDILKNNPKADSAYNKIISVKDKNIINLTEYSNTDLKLKYGVANLEALTEYEDNYTLLIKNLAVLGHILKEQDDITDATHYLEYSIRIGSDIRSCYADLKDIYISQNRTEKVDKLRQYASMINSVNKELIINLLND